MKKKLLRPVPLMLCALLAIVILCTLMWVRGEEPFTRVPILMYHHVLSASENKLYTENSSVLPLEDFERQMKYLYDNGYKSITSDQLLAFLDGSPLPRKSVMITFDDGYLSNVVNAYPVMKKYGFNGVVFVLTKLAPQEQQPFDPDKIQYLSVPDMENTRDVFEYCSHTHAMHVFIDDKPALIASTNEQIEADLHQSLSVKYMSSKGFAFPFGLGDAHVIESLKEMGIRFAVTTQAGYTHHLSDEYDLRRFGIYRGITMDEFRKIVK